MSSKVGVGMSLLRKRAWRLGVQGQHHYGPQKQGIDWLRRNTTRGFHSSSRLLSSHRDYYDVLGVDRNADDKTLKKRYRELAKKYHPDSSKEEDATTKFQEINHAYEVLSDPEKRKAYDSFGPDYEQAMNSGGASGMNMSDFEDLFSHFGGFGFGSGGAGGFQRGTQAMGNDHRVQLKLSFMEAVNGCSKTFSYMIDKACSTCNGSGAKAGESAKTENCRACNGQGVRIQSMGGGMFQVPTACDVCSGTGKTIVNKCTTCKGSGLQRKKESVTLDIPPGVDSGMTVSSRGGGHRGRLGGPAGDLLVDIMVTPDPYFKRNGNDVHTKLKVSLAQAILGDKIGVRTLTGDVDLTVPSGVRHGEVRRLRGKGIPDVSRPVARGDQYVQFEIEMPTKLSDRQKELIREFEEEEKKKAKA